MAKRELKQPLEVINIPGALVRLDTLGAACARARSSLDRDIRAGRLKVVKLGKRCTRIRSEDARAYLALLAGGSAA